MAEIQLVPAMKGPAPLDPDTTSGSKKMHELVVRRVQAEVPHARAEHTKLSLQWLERTSGVKENTFCVKDMAVILDRNKVYVTRGASDTDKWQAAILTAMVEKPENLREGEHYFGEVKVTKKRKLSMSNQHVKHNSNIIITRQGAFVLFGLLAENRADFLNSIWKVMEVAHQVYLDMKAKVEQYKTQLDQAKEVRNAGAARFNTMVVQALNVPVLEAQRPFMVYHKLQMQHGYFRGRTPSQAIAECKLVKPDAKKPVMHRLFSPHGQIAEQYRLSYVAEAIQDRLQEIEEEPDMEGKKAIIREVCLQCQAHFKDNQVFDWPWRTFEAQVQSFFNLRKEEPRRGIRR